MSTLVVTGTGTEIGKTIVTAAVAAVAAAAGRDVAVVKAAQTGIEGSEEADVDVVRRLSRVADVHELVRYPEPLAPATAARRAGVPTLRVAAMAEHIRALAGHDLILVEGAGGLLVRLDEDGHTIADLAGLLAAPVLVVAAAGLGTLNGIGLTCEALRRRGLRCAGVVIGAWPSEPDLAAQANLDDVESYAGAPLLGVVPDGAGRLSAADFRAVARRALAPELGGEWARPAGIEPATNRLEGGCSIH
ncbi:MAG: dethiobiotin synthetase [Frankiaceae bacterium]|nr:dethiobiotin synthetase [Frankiaceae bacterium]